MPDAEVRRQRAAYRKGLLRAAAVAALVVAAIGGLAFATIIQRNRAEAEARRADQNFQQADRNADEARKNLTEAERHRLLAEDQKATAEEQRQAALNQQALAEEQRDRAEQQEESNRLLLYAAHMDLAGQAWDSASISQIQELLDRHLPKPGQQDLRGFEWYYLWRLTHSELLNLSHAGMVSSVAFSPSGTILVTAGDADQGVKLWDVATGKELMSLKGHTKIVNQVAFSADGKKLATASNDHTARLWEVATGRELAILKPHTAEVSSVAFSPSDKILATGSYDKTIKLWDVATGQESLTLNRPADRKM